MFKKEWRKKDGRRLILYASSKITLLPLEETESTFEAHPHMRWHPLREEWVIYAPHRKERIFLPPPEFCPLCPSRPGTFPTEIPFEKFEIAVFENRFPSLCTSPPPPPDLFLPTLAGQGICEVLVYTDEHIGSLGTISQERRELLVRVWIDRYQELYNYDFVKYVMPFENRGEEVGVTLHHPHGQIYAYPFIPPVIAQELRAFQKASVLENFFPHLELYLVTQNEAFVAFVPPCARYPYEVWIVPKRKVSGPWSFSDAEIQEFAEILGEIVNRYDLLFNRPFPYIMVFHAAPKGVEDFHFHVEFYSPLRAPGKLKFLAGTEQGAGVMVVDALPEDAAAELRKIKV